MTKFTAAEIADLDNCIMARMDILKSVRSRTELTSGPRQTIENEIYRLRDIARKLDGDPLTKDDFLGLKTCIFAKQNAISGISHRGFFDQAATEELRAHTEALTVLVKKVVAAIHEKPKPRKTPIKYEWLLHEDEDDGDVHYFDICPELSGGQEWIELVKWAPTGERLDAHCRIDGFRWSIDNEFSDGSKVPLKYIKQFQNRIAEYHEKISEKGN